MKIRFEIRKTPRLAGEKFRRFKNENGNRFDTCQTNFGAHMQNSHEQVAKETRNRSKTISIDLKMSKEWKDFLISSIFPSIKQSLDLFGWFHSLLRVYSSKDYESGESLPSKQQTMMHSIVAEMLKRFICIVKRKRFTKL